MSRSRILHHVGIKDFKRVHQRQIGEQKERAAKELKEWQEAEERKKKREEELKPFKSDWRSTLTESEWYAIFGSGPTNSASQTFAFGDPGSGIETTVSGIGGQDAYSSTVTIDGETYDAPTYNQLALQGYAPLIQMQRRIDQQDVNSMLDASQQFAQAVGADYMMNARVSSEPVFRDPNIPLSDEEIEAQYQHNVGIADNFLKSVGTSYQEIVDKGIVLIDGRAYILVKENGKYQKLKIVKQNPHDSAAISMGYTYNGEPYIENSIDEKEVYFHELENLKLPKLPTFTPKSETKIDPEKLNYSSMEDYFNSLPPGVRDNMLRGGKTKDIVSDIADIAIAYALQKMIGSDWHMRTLSNKAHEVYKTTGVLPKGITAWEPWTAFTPKMLKTLPTKTAWIFGGPVGYTAGMTAYSLASQARDAFFDFIRKKQEEKKVNKSTTWDRIQKYR